MQRVLRPLVAAVLLCLPGTAHAQPKTAEPAVGATIETTLATAGKQIRMYAFDGDPATYFGSAKDVGSADHFTLILDKPVAMKAIAVTTGRTKGGDLLDDGLLEASADGKKFQNMADCKDG